MLGRREELGFSCVMSGLRDLPFPPCSARCRDLVDVDGIGLWVTVKLNEP